MATFLQVVWALLGILSCAGAALADTHSTPADTGAYTVVARQPHKSLSFTQGLIFEDGALVETSGQYGRSFIFRYDADSSKELAAEPLPKQIFAEGLTRWGDEYIVLSWQSGRALRLAASNFEVVGEFRYPGQGWGLTHDGAELIMSDGSHVLSFRDPKNFALTRRIEVRDERRAWGQLNELEYARGLIWANVWQPPYVLAIPPADGRVLAKYDLSVLVEQSGRRRGEAVLNGIAFDAERDTFWVTGKYWPDRYEIKLAQPLVNPLPKAPVVIAPAPP